MVAHHRIRGDVDGEDVRELLDALGYPAAAVIEVPAGEVVLSTQEGSAYASRDAVVPRGVVEGDKAGAGLSHGAVP